MRQGNAVGKWHVKTGIGVGLHRFGEPAGSPFISWDKWSSVGEKVTKQTDQYGPIALEMGETGAVKTFCCEPEKFCLSPILQPAISC